MIWTPNFKSEMEIFNWSKFHGTVMRSKANVISFYGFRHQINIISAYLYPRRSTAQRRPDAHVNKVMSNVKIRNVRKCQIANDAYRVQYFQDSVRFREFVMSVAAAAVQLH